MPFIFKVAILIEAIRSNCGGEWAKDRRWFLTLSLLRCATHVLVLVRSRRISALFYNFIFISGWGLSRIVRFRVFIRRVGCAVRGHCVLVQPICTFDVCHNLLSGAFFSLRVCMQGLRCLSGWPIVKCRHFCVHGCHFLGVSTGSEVDWVCVLVLGLQIMPLLVSAVLLFPTNI